MKALEELTADIREKLPRLRENKETILDDGSFGIMFIEPRDPMLNDVLEFIDNDEVSMYTDGVFSHVLNGLYYDENSEMIKWDLSKPYLKDQSPELIKFLHGLINH